MPQAARPASSLVRFGVFELDLESGDLRKSGRRVKLDHQPLQVLELLLEKPGRLVTREELQRTLWPAGTFVDFEQGINAIVKRLRRTLGDSAETPRFVETLPRRGFRFIHPIETLPTSGSRSYRVSFRWLPVLALFTMVTAALVGVGVNARKVTTPAVTAIAVLPLDNLTGEPAQEPIVDGLHDELITELAQISALKVISRTSVLRYKLTRKPLREIAADLGVDGILEGAVRRDGERWHVTAQLISARDDRHVWAQSYERGFRDMAAIPREIARGIAGRLDITLLPHEQARLSKTVPVDPAAFKAYFKGKYYAAKATKDAFREAVRSFQEALDVDPTYAAAWEALGSTYAGLGGWGGRGDDDGESGREFRRLAAPALERALQLDPTLRQPHQTLGLIKFAEWEWEGGAREFARAKELDPGYPGFSWYLLTVGRFDEAVEAADRVAQLDPLNYFSQLAEGWTAFMAKHYDDAIVALKRAVELNPQLPAAHFELGWCYAKKAMHSQAIAECETALASMRRTNPKAFVAQGCEWVYAVAGRRREALELVGRLTQEDDDRYFTRLAHVYDALGDRERSLAYLQKAFDQKAGSLPRQWYVPMLSDEIKMDPRFQELFRRIGHPWARFPERRDLRALAAGSTGH